MLLHALGCLAPPVKAPDTVLSVNQQYDQFEWALVCHMADCQQDMTRA